MTEGETFLKVTFHKHPMCPECLSHWGSHDETCPMKKVAKEIDGLHLARKMVRGLRAAIAVDNLFSRTANYEKN